MSILYRLLRSRIATISLSLFLLGAVYQTIQVVYKTYETETQIHTLQSQMNEGIKKREQLLDLQKIIQSDFFAEREARIKLGMKKENERVVVIPSEAEKYEATISSKDNSSKQENSFGNKNAQTKNSTLWWNYFFTKR